MTRLLKFLLLLLPLAACSHLTPEPREHVLKSMREALPDESLICENPVDEAARDEVYPTPIKGLYQIESCDGEIFYYFLPTGHRFFGELYAPDGANLAQPLRDKRMMRRWDDIVANREEAIKVGIGPVEVYEIIDPSSSSSRLMHEFWKSRDDVTRYVFLISLEGPGAETDWMSDYILGAADREKALRQVLEGKVTKRPEDISLEGQYAFNRMQDFLIRMDVESAPQYLIRGKMVKDPDPDLVREALDGPAPN